MVSPKIRQLMEVSGNSPNLVMSFGNIAADVLNLVLDLIYTGEVEISSNRAHELERALEELQIADCNVVNMVNK